MDGVINLHKENIMKRYIRANDNANDISDAIKNAWFQALKDCDLEEEDVHVLSYKEASQFQKALERELDNRHIDLSFKHLTIAQNGDGTMIEGLRVGGNSGGIANSLIRGIIKNAWEPLSRGHWEKYIQDAEEQDDAIYEQDKYGYCNPVTAKRALQLIGLGDKTQYSGHGSQQYIDDTTVNVYMDAFGSIKVNRSTVRYD